MAYPYFEIVPGVYGDSMDLCVTWNDHVGDRMRETGTRELGIYTDFGDRKPEFRFLRDFRDLQAIAVEPTSEHAPDFEPLYDLIDLKAIRCSFPAGHCPDLSSFSRLEQCGLNMKTRNADSVFGCESLRILSARDLSRSSSALLSKLTSLEDLRIYASSSPSIDSLEALVNLRSLHLEDCARLGQLKLFDNPSRLRHLEIRGCGKLANLEFVSSLNGLETLQVSDCGRITNLEPLACCSKLRYLELTGLGDVVSLKPLATLANLELLNVRTKVIDSDFAFVNEMSNLWYLMLPSRISEAQEMKRKYPLYFFGHVAEHESILSHMRDSDIPDVRKRYPDLQWTLDRMIVNGFVRDETGQMVSAKTGEPMNFQTLTYPYNPKLVWEAKESNYITNAPGYIFSPEWDPKPRSEYDRINEEENQRRLALQKSALMEHPEQYPSYRSN